MSLPSGVHPITLQLEIAMDTGREVGGAWVAGGMWVAGGAWEIGYPFVVGGLEVAGPWEVGGQWVVGGPWEVGGPCVVEGLREGWKRGGVWWVWSADILQLQLRTASAGMRLSERAGPEKGVWP